MRGSYKSFFLLLLLLIVLSCKKEKSEVNNNVTPNNFLSDQKYEKLTIEIIYVSGFEPTTATVENLKTFLSQLLHKPGGINVVMTPISSTGHTTLSLDEVKQIENNSRTQNTSRKTLTASIIFADADYIANGSKGEVLGIAYGYSSMVIFEKTIRALSGGVTQPSTAVMESSVTEHEFGHVLGLVNNGSNMVTAHEDPANKKHCINKDCLMYWNNESGDMSGVLGSAVPTLDLNCKIDLIANGGK